jgi:hypothetical protein
MNVWVQRAFDKWHSKLAPFQVQPEAKSLIKQANNEPTVEVPRVRHPPEISRWYVGMEIDERHAQRPLPSCFNPGFTPF